MLLTISISYVKYWLPRVLFQFQILNTPDCYQQERLNGTRNSFKPSNEYHVWRIWRTYTIL